MNLPGGTLIDRKFGPKRRWYSIYIADLACFMFVLHFKINSYVFVAKMVKIE